jgi:hypothetical protein
MIWSDMCDMVLKIYVDEDNNGFLLIMISCLRHSGSKLIE